MAASINVGSFSFKDILIYIILSQSYRYRNYQLVALFTDHLMSKPKFKPTHKKKGTVSSDDVGTQENVKKQKREDEDDQEDVRQVRTVAVLILCGDLCMSVLINILVFL